jgi:excisionase family DNA binding protein
MVTDRALSLTEAAERLGWERRTLVRALKRHGIATIGTGRRARLETSDIDLLKAKERSKSARAPSIVPLQEPERVFRATGTPHMDAETRSYWRRRLGQINRRSLLEKATSPLKIILSFTDLAKTAQQLEVLSRAVEDAMAIARDDELDETQRRVNLRGAMKAAAIAINEMSGLGYGRKPRRADSELR